jgi:hypothetical protein
MKMMNNLIQKIFLIQNKNKIKKFFRILWIIQIEQKQIEIFRLQTQIKKILLLNNKIILLLVEIVEAL